MGVWLRALKSVNAGVELALSGEWRRLKQGIVQEWKNNGAWWGGRQQHVVSQADTLA